MDKKTAWKYWDELPTRVQDAFRYANYGFADKDIHTIFLLWKEKNYNEEHLVNMIKQKDDFISLTSGWLKVARR